MRFAASIAFACVLALPNRATAAPITITFDSLADSDTVVSQFLDLTFSNAMVLTAGISLNEFEFPPHSGDNVVFDNGGAISIAFATPIYSFGGFFTYTAPLTLTAFDADNQFLGSVSSIFSTNLALSGDAGSGANEQLQLLSTIAFTSITIMGDPSGASLTIDDLTYDPTSPASVPEPSTLTLLTSGVIAALLGRKRGTTKTSIDNTVRPPHPIGTESTSPV